MANDDGAQTPPSGGGSDDEDAWADEFAREFEAMRAKVAKIPDDIGEKLDQIMQQGQSNARTPAPQPRGTSQRSEGAPQGQPEPQQSAQSPVSQPEKKPKPTHWYYRERGGRG